MPGLNAIISADSNPMRREFEEVNRMSQRAGAQIRSNIGGHGGVRSGAIRETLVLLREMANGNWTRVPGSLSILIGQMGLFTGATAGAIGVLGTLTGILAGVAAGAAVAWFRIQQLSKSLTGLELPDFKTEYIAAHLQKINQVAEGWKQINKEIRNAVDLYNSASKAAERVAEATKKHFEHERKMNSFEKDPAKKAAKELEIDQQERAAELANKEKEQLDLQAEGSAKKKEADSLNVNSKEHDAELIRKTKADADAAEKFLKEHKIFGTMGDKAKATALGGLFGAQSTFDAMSDADKSKVAAAQAAIQAHKNAVDRSAANDEIRDRKKDLTKQSGDAFAKAGVIGVSLPDLKAAAAQANKDSAEEAAAKMAGSGKMVHGTVNALQQVGAYASPASSALVTVGHHQLHELKKINSHLQKIGAGGGKNPMGRVNYGG